MNVLACVDFDGSTADVVGAAASLAAATGGQLIVAHVSAPEPDFVGYDDHILTSDDQSRAREQLRERLCAELAALGLCRKLLS